MNTYLKCFLKYIWQISTLDQSIILRIDFFSELACFQANRFTLFCAKEHI